MNRPSAPVKVSIDLTTRCNLSCVHCRHSRRDATHDELEYDQVRSVLDDLARISVFRIGISGGEPFIRDDAPDLIRYAAARAPGRVFVSTNGTLVDDDLLTGLSPAKNRLTFKISLDGPREIHDAVRGRTGAFDTASGAIKLCHERGFCVEVTTTVSRETIPYLDDLARYVMGLGCSRYNFIEIIPVGNATRAMCLDSQMRMRTWNILQRIRAENPSSESAILIRIPFAGTGTQALGCTAGTRECGILADGSVVGCRLLPHIREGNVKTRSISDIWSDPRSFGFFLEASPAGRDPLCRTCPRLNTCRGGCRAYSLGFLGDAAARDPRCPGPAADPAYGYLSPVHPDNEQQDRSA